MVRRVRTPEGSRRYRLPIGAPIVDRPEAPAVVAALRRAIDSGDHGAVEQAVREVYAAAAGRRPGAAQVVWMRDVLLIGRPDDARLSAMVPHLAGFLDAVAGAGGASRLDARSVADTIRLLPPDALGSLFEQVARNPRRPDNRRPTWTVLSDYMLLLKGLDDDRAWRPRDAASAARAWEILRADTDDVHFDRPDLWDAATRRDLPRSLVQWQVVEAAAFNRLPARRAAERADDVRFRTALRLMAKPDPSVPMRVVPTFDRLWGSLDERERDRWTRGGGLDVLKTGLIAVESGDWPEEDLRGWLEFGDRFPEPVAPGGGVLLGPERRDVPLSLLAELWHRDPRLAELGVRAVWEFTASNGTAATLANVLAWVEAVGTEKALAHADAEDLPTVMALGADLDDDALAVAADLRRAGFLPATAAWVARRRDRLSRLSAPVTETDPHEALAVLSMSDDEWERYRSERDSGADHLAAWRKVLGVGDPSGWRPVGTDPPEGAPVADLSGHDDWAENDRPEVKAETARRLSPSLDPEDLGPLLPVTAPSADDLTATGPVAWAAWSAAPDRVRFAVGHSGRPMLRYPIVEGAPDPTAAEHYVSDRRTIDGRDWATEVVATVVDSWAGTANDEDSFALAVQERARALFGLEGTMDWQMDDAARQRVAAVERSMGPWIDRLLAAMWRATQERYPPGTVFHVWRGWRHERRSGRLPKKQGPANVAFRPVSSWSFARNVAATFAEDADVPDGVPVVAEAWVPVERVLSIADGTGFGCLPEWEVTVLGGAHEVRLERP
jgi:hypothetical protein